MTSEVIIRIATNDDIPSIVKLWSELMDFHAKRDHFFERGKNSEQACKEHMEYRLKHEDENKMVVAEVDGKIAGYSLATYHKYYPVFDRDYYGEIVDLAVSSDFRRMGIGNKLVTEVSKWFDEKNIKRIHVTVAINNEISTKFWRKMGFSDFKEILFREN